MLWECESAKLVSGRRIDNDAPIARRHQIRLRQWCRIPHPPKWPGTTSARHPSCSGAHLPDTELGCSSNHGASLSAYSLPRFLTHSALHAVLCEALTNTKALLQRLEAGIYVPKDRQR